jgi:hypothetical protein
VVKNPKRLLLIALGVYLLGFGTLCGMAIERMRFDRQRTEMLARQEQALHDRNAYRMALEKRVASPAPDSAAGASRP